MGYRHLEVLPASGSLGAEVRGVSLASALPDEVFAEIQRAFLEHAVLFFREQPLDRGEQLAFASRFGTPEVHPIVDGLEATPEVVRVLKPAGESASFGTGWHTDNTFFAAPSMATVLYGERVPPFGGDTLFASMERAYDALSPAFRERLSGLAAVHSASRAYDPAVTGEAKYKGDAPIRYRWSDSIRDEVEHPIVRTHPETGRRSLFVNPMFTLRIVGMTDSESRALLDFLFEHCAQPDFQCRFRWENDSVAVWDNRCVWHYAMDDYREHERLMFRVTLAGDVPR
ncbi:MAG: TauD/TfdA family dioxygenase [Myxococcales bacterium]|nr:TauD/TfdA family dioxygenase [Myxococcales bacterium]